MQSGMVCVRRKTRAAECWPVLSPHTSTNRTPGPPPSRSKNTIDTVYAKLQKAEAEGEAGVHGASTGEVMESVLQVGCWDGGVGYGKVVNMPRQVLF